MSSGLVFNDYFHIMVRRLVGVKGCSVLNHSVLNKKLIEYGFTPWWVMTRNECKQYWKNVNNDERNRGNRPLDYFNKDIDSCLFLVGVFSGLVDKGDHVLELGCNVGTNLNVLFDSGYTCLSGVEINSLAVDMMRERYLNLRDVVVYDGSIESVLGSLGDGCVDVVFSMAVLMHVHPGNGFVFRDMVRVARKYVVTFEDEFSCCSYVFPRDYRSVFCGLGCEMVLAVRYNDRFVVRVFSVPGFRGDVL